MHSDTTQRQAGAMWTPAFEALHAAVLAGADTAEIQRLEAAELDEVHGRGEQR